MALQGKQYDIRNTTYAIREASVAELADAPGLGPGVRYGRGGSSPLARNDFLAGNLL